MWTVVRADAYEKDIIKQKWKFPRKVRMWLHVWSKGIPSFVIIVEEIVDHAYFIENMLPTVSDYDSLVYSNEWPFQ
jgi:hypothetical protein